MRAAPKSWSKYTTPFTIKVILPFSFFFNFSGEPLLATWHSSTPSVKPLSHDRLYYFLPYWDEKPTMYIRSMFPDHRKRMYISNAIGKIADKVVSLPVLRFRQKIVIEYPNLNIQELVAQS